MCLPYRDTLAVHIAPCTPTSQYNMISPVYLVSDAGTKCLANLFDFAVKSSPITSSPSSYAVIAPSPQRDCSTLVAWSRQLSTTPPYLTSYRPYRVTPLLDVLHLDYTFALLLTHDSTVLRSSRSHNHFSPLYLPSMDKQSSTSHRAI
jgi:hypothetical protein